MAKLVTRDVNGGLVHEQEHGDNHLDTVCDDSSTSDCRAWSQSVWGPWWKCPHIFNARRWSYPCLGPPDANCANWCKYTLFGHFAHRLANRGPGMQPCPKPRYLPLPPSWIHDAFATSCQAENGVQESAVAPTFLNLKLTSVTACRLLFRPRILMRYCQR